MSNPETTGFSPGDRVIWRYDGDEYTVDRIRDFDHPRPVWLRKRMFGDGPIELASAHPSELVKLP